MKHEAPATVHAPDRTAPSLQNGHAPPLDAAPRRSSLRALLSSARTLFQRSQPPTQPLERSSLLDNFSGPTIQVPPIDSPEFDRLLSPPVQEPPTEQPLSTPLPELPARRQELLDEFIALEGSPGIVAYASSIRERFWTHVVRYLAAESSYGASPEEIAHLRRFYMQSANSKSDAMWWVQNIESGIFCTLRRVL